MATIKKIGMDGASRAEMIDLLNECAPNAADDWSTRTDAELAKAFAYYVPQLPEAGGLDS